MIKLKGGEVQSEKCMGQGSRWRPDRFNFKAASNLKIHHVWGRDHGKPAFSSIIRGKKGDITPPFSENLVAYKKETHSNFTHLAAALKD